MSGYSARMEAIIEEVKEQGFDVARTKKGHYKFTPPKGRIIYTSGTPSDWRALSNFIADLRRVGYKTRGDIAREKPMGVNPLSDALKAAIEEPARQVPKSKLDITSLVADFLSRRGRTGASTKDVYAYVAAIREGGVTESAVINALTRSADRGQIVRQSRGARGIPARWRALDETDRPLTAPAPEAPGAHTPAIPMPTLPPSAAPAAPDAGTYAPAGRTGDPAIDKDIEILEGALAALANIEEVVRRNRDILMQFAKLKTMLNT